MELLTILYAGLFIISGCLLYFSAKWVVGSLMRIAKFLGWREFVVAFFIMAVAVTLPNLFIGINSAFQKIPELSLGDVLGNNLVALTLAVALAIFFTSKKEIVTDGKITQKTVVFTLITTIILTLLLFDGTLSRIDGALLIAIFFFYVYWVFSKKDHFTRLYDGFEEKFTISKFFKDLLKLLGGIGLLLVATQGIIQSMLFFSARLEISLLLVGILIIGVGNALPEVFFAIASARKNETSLILGNLMGAVIVPSTLVLGLVSLINPIEVSELDVAVVSRIFLIFAVAFFFWFARSHLKITKKEAYFLLLIYVLFVIAVIFFDIV